MALVMAYTVLMYTGTAAIAMAYIVMAQPNLFHSLCSHDVYSYGLHSSWPTPPHAIVLLECMCACCAMHACVCAYMCVYMQ